MNDVIVTGVTHGGSGDSGHSENVSLAFAKVALEYKPQKPDGSLDAGDLLQVRPQGPEGRLEAEYSGGVLFPIPAPDVCPAPGTCSSASRAPSPAKINGEAQDSKHKDEIEVLAWSWGMQGSRLWPAASPPARRRYASSASPSASTGRPPR